MPHADPAIRAEYLKKYWEKNREKKRLLARNCYHRNKHRHREREKERARAYRAKNKDEIKARRPPLDKEYYLKNKEKISSRMRSYYENNKTRIVRNALLRRERLAGRPKPDFCECCGATEVIRGSNGKIKSLAWDHSHKTGKFRGWLCHRCNVCLGLLDDSKTLILALVRYLENYASS